MTTAPAISATGHAWHSQSAEDVLAQLRSSATGLSAHEAAKRLAATAGVAFAVYLYVLRTGSIETARTAVFDVLVFAELLRSFGARSETRAVWRISLLSNVSLVVVVAVSFAFQVWSQHNATLGRFLKTMRIPLTDCLVLVAIGAIPLLILELLKMVRRRGQRRTESHGYATAT